eukprot:6183051-Pleurochrysis_carterae.AAC.6
MLGGNVSKLCSSSLLRGQKAQQRYSIGRMKMSYVENSNARQASFRRREMRACIEGSPEREKGVAGGKGREGRGRSGEKEREREGEREGEG